MRHGLIRIGKGLIHILVLLLLLVAASAFFMRMMNQGTPDAAQEMANSTFPLIYMEKGGVQFNALHGYAREMDVTRMRESITPLDASREIGIQIDTFSSAVDTISYQVYTLSGEQLENTSVTRYEQSEGSVHATLQLQNKILMDQEYVLCITLSSAGRNMYYYTHVLLADGLHTQEYLNFVNGFYDKTVNRTDLDSIAAAVEPDETTDVEQTLHTMDIHDSVTQLTWGELKPQMYYKPTPRLTEINDNTATLTTQYRIAAVNEIGLTEIYNVEEYYRVRFTDSRVFLLNFSRSTDEVFNPDNKVLEDTGIRLGITGKNIEYKADEKSRVVAFVQENELWSYEKSTGKLTQIFSFPQKEDMDYRDFYNAHDISILRVDSTGNVWFTVEGYMNRGAYEGENGVDLCYYDAATDMVDEKIFLSSTLQYDLLEQSVESSAYVSADGSLFSVLIEGTLYKVDVSARTYTEIAAGIDDTCYVGSGGGRYFAYLPEGKEYGSSTLTQVDLETGKSVDFTAPQGQKIRPVAYMGNALVYGLAADEDLANGALDWGYFPMYALKIVDGEGQELKNYQPDGLVVTNVEQSDHMLSLTRMSREGNGFTAAPADQIVDTDTAGSVNMGSATKMDARKQTQVYLRVGDAISYTDPQVLRSKVIGHTAKRIVEMPKSAETDNNFYVYASGGLQAIYSRANEAVHAADETFGVVLDGLQRYVWVRGDKQVKAEIQLDKVPAAMVNGLTDVQTLADETGKTVLDLTGCTLDEVLYFVSHGTPVTALTTDGPVTIVGYDEYNTYQLDPGASEWYYYGMNDSTERFQAAGNVFYTYLEDVRY